MGKNNYHKYNIRYNENSFHMDLIMTFQDYTQSTDKGECIVKGYELFEESLNINDEDDIENTVDEKESHKILGLEDYFKLKRG